MAEDKKIGQEYILEIDPAGGTSYDTVVCLKSFSFGSEDAEIDASSFCGTEIVPGTTTETIEFEGIQLFDPASGKISGADLYATKKLKTKIGWTISPVGVAVTGDVTKVGTGYLTNIGEAYGLDEPISFTGTIKIIGAATQTITV